MQAGGGGRADRLLQCFWLEISLIAYPSLPSHGQHAGGSHLGEDAFWRSVDDHTHMPFARAGVWVWEGTHGFHEVCGQGGYTYAFGS